MSVQVEPIETGFAVYFPFELKDQFKKAFPSAKWNPMKKRWEVGPRSKTRLEQWAAVAAPTAQELEEAAEAEFTAAELAQVQTELAVFRARIAAARQKTLALNELADLRRRLPLRRYQRAGQRQCQPTRSGPPEICHG